MALKNIAAIANKIIGAVNLVAGVVLAILFPPLAGLVDSESLMLLLSTNAFIATFFFGNMWKSVFDSVVLVFVEHPFDVGDRCDIEEIEVIQNFKIHMWYYILTIILTYVFSCCSILDDC